MRDERNYCSRTCLSAIPPIPPDLNEDGVTARLTLLGRHGVVHGYAVIDASDAAWAGQWQWTRCGEYAGRSVESGGHKQTILLHRELLELVPFDGMEGDHIDRNKLNDCRANLRVIPKPGQQQNLPRQDGRSSVYRGVSWNKKTRRWHAYAQVAGKRHHLGRFVNEADAAEAARAGRHRLMPYATD